MDLTYRFDPFQNLSARKIDTAAQAIDALAEGNRQFAAIVDRLREAFQGEQGEAIILPLDPIEFGVSMVEGTAVAQEPFALVLGCSDARAPVELLFHQTSNDLFVVRVAGNVLGVECLGSIDYAVRKMASSLRLVVVLGHLGCGAVTAAVDMYLEPGDYPDLGLTHSLRSLIDRVMIAVRGAAKALERAGGSGAVHAPGYRAALLEIAVYLNAALTSHDVKQELKAMGDGHGIEVVYGVFDIATQRVAPRPLLAASAGETPLFLAAPDEAIHFERLVADLVRSVVERGILYRAPG